MKPYTLTLKFVASARAGFGSRLGSTSLLLLAAVGITTPAYSQTAHHAERIRGPVRDAGVFHVATGTWTRTSGSILGLGASSVLFNNNAPSGYYDPMDPNEVLYGEGRLPSLDSEGTADSYEVSCFQIGYCTNAAISVTVNTSWWNCYTSCSNPTTSGSTQVGSTTTTGLPGSQLGFQNCWIVTVDLTGSTDQFQITGDCNGLSDGSNGFGWGVQLQNFTGASTGLIITGDPANAPFGAGTEPAWGFPPGLYGTGLGEQDQFYIDDLLDDAADGCYWFGGYQNNSIWGGHWHRLEGVEAGDCVADDYCQTSPNSVGSGALIGHFGTLSIADNTFTVRAGQCPPNQFGIFFYGLEQASVPFGNGVLCVGPGSNVIHRLVPPLLTDALGNVLRLVDFTQPPASMDLGEITPGSTWNFQFWYRDPAGGGAFFNLSNALSATFCP